MRAMVVFLETMVSFCLQQLAGESSAFSERCVPGYLKAASRPLPSPWHRPMTLKTGHGLAMEPGMVFIPVKLNGHRMTGEETLTWEDS